MSRPTIREIAFSRSLAAERQRELDARRDLWRPCPATAHLHPDHRAVCSDCGGQICKRMQAKGLGDDAHPLPPSERPTCDAKTRAGGTCKKKVIPGMTRCGCHGGKSTGPRTAEGKARIAEAQHKRWAKWRASR